MAPKAPELTRPYRRSLDAEGEAKLAALVAATPDASEEELIRDLAEVHDIHISRSTVNRVLTRLNLTRQKRDWSGPAPSPPTVATPSPPQRTVLSAAGT